MYDSLDGLEFFIGFRKLFFFRLGVIWFNLFRIAIESRIYRIVKYFSFKARVEHYLPGTHSLKYLETTK